MKEQQPNKFKIKDLFFAPKLYYGEFINSVHYIRDIEFNQGWGEYIYNKKYIESKCFDNAADCANLCKRLNRAIKGIV